MPRTHYVYILANKYNNALYIGVTNNLRERVYQHKHTEAFSHTSRYNITKLVYFESFEYVEKAIAREKQLKGGSRGRKDALINEHNPTWRELKP